MRRPGRRFPPLGLGLAALGIILAVAVLLGERGASDGNRARTAPAAIGACLSRSAKLAVTRRAVASATATAERAVSVTAGATATEPRRGAAPVTPRRPEPPPRRGARPRAYVRSCWPERAGTRSAGRGPRRGGRRGIALRPAPPAEPSADRGEPLGVRFGQQRGELPAGSDAELAVGVGEVDLDRLLGHEERLGDLPVRQLRSGERSHPPLGRRERGHACGLAARGPPTARSKSGPSTPLERGGTTPLGELERAQEGLAALLAPASLP